MKFWKKIVFAVIALISVILGVSRYFVVKNNFLYSIENSYKQNFNKHILEKYMIESNIIKNIQEGNQVTDQSLIDQMKSLYTYIDDNSELVALYAEDYQKIYSNFEAIDKLNIKSLLDKKIDTYAIEEIDKKHYMLFSTCLNINNAVVYIVNSYDINNLYEERDRQIKDLLLRDIIILVSAFFIVEVVSKLVTNHVNRLNLLVKQKDDFITGFTHELKTPMTAIMGYSDMLRLKKCDEEVSKTALNYIYSEAKRLENLSFKLMMLMSLSDEEIELKSLEIESLINNIVKSESLVLSENKLKLELEKYYVLADSDLLEVVIRNLIENANKAEPKDHKILVKGEILENKKYRISVIDSGKGIPKEHIDRVTESFYMVDKSRSRANGGTGIGLSLVKKILEIHNSKIVIDSEENVGTTIYFDLKEARNEDK